MTDIEWWYQFAFLIGDNGGKYAIMSAFYLAGELPVQKGHYLIFSLIDLNNCSSRSFSLLDNKLVKNMLLLNLPVYLFQCPCDKNVWKLYEDLLHGKLPLPHQWISSAYIEKNPVSLFYGNSSIKFSKSNDEAFEVTLSADGIEASLTFNLMKPAALIGGNGKPDLLYYYSFTRNKVKGYIKKDGVTEHATGQGWFDHQWGYLGDLLTKTGWNWFGLQLEDGRELLINEFRTNKTGKTFSPMANIIESNGFLKFTRDLTLQPLDYWVSPFTGTKYPLGWRIEIPEFNMVVHVSAFFPEEEMPVIGPLQSIWEGVCSVSLREFNHTPLSGIGFLELVGYANNYCLKNKEALF